MTEVAASPIVRSQSLQFELDADRGVFHLSDPATGARVASNLECAAVLDSGTVRSSGARAIWRPLPETDGRALEIQFQADEDLLLGLLVRADDFSGGLTFSLTVTNHGRDRTLRRASVLTTGDTGQLDFCPCWASAGVFRNGWQSWDRAGAVRAGDPGVDPTSLESWLVGAVVNVESRQGLALAFSGASTHFSRIRLHPDGDAARLDVAVEGSDTILRQGTALLSEILWAGFGPEPARLFLDYGRYRNPEGAAPRLPVMVDSWFMGFEDTGEKEILAALEEVRDIPEIDTFVVGDGYQKIHQDGPGIGDWLETNNRYPHGLRWLSDQIRRRGLRPGIWVAPFLIGEKCQFRRYYPDGVVRTREASRADWFEMWRGDRVYYLDGTHPDSRHFLRTLFETLTYRDGFEVFVIDFAYAAAVEGFRRDRSATPAQALESALALIRDTVGDRRTLILSGAPLGVGSRYVDAIRTTADPGPHWGGPCGALSVYRNTVTRSLLGPLPAAAPAPIVPGDLTDDEFRLLVTAAGLSGGPVALSGMPRAFSATQRHMISQALAPYPQPSVPLDLFDRPTPQIVGQPIPMDGLTHWLVGAFNTGGSPADRRIDLSRLGATGPCHVYDYWNRQYLGLENRAVAITALAPHSCRLLAVQPDLARPQLLASGGHIHQAPLSVRRTTWTPGEAPRPGRLAVELARPGTHAITLHFVAPEGMLARSVTSRNGRVRLTREKSATRLTTVEAAFRDHCTFELGW